MRSERGKNELARYEQIALDIARRITNNEFKEGEKLRGRSVLAGRYHVSPETIRRAISILQNKGIVETVSGIGTIVKRRGAAKKFVETFEYKNNLFDMLNDLAKLQEERKIIDRRIDQLMEELGNYISDMVNSLQEAEEITIKKGSPLIGENLASLDLRTKTGATVAAVWRDGEQIMSPDAQFTFKEGDILLVVGNKEAKRLVKEMVN
ncbi:MAG TPA: GntR family transcriptional regulator [Clostridia bacterium]|nr:GntR family transcriptional regulator [Clostridia bacterium]